MSGLINAKIKKQCLLLVLYGLLVFPLFYFVYKFGTPFLGMIDFYDYYKLYDTMDFKAADSPLNMRLVGSFFVFCMNKAGFFYDTATQVDGAAFSKQIFFNAVFFNYLCVTTTCVFIFNLVKKQGSSNLMSFLAGLLYILGFGTIFFEIMPLADAFSVLLFVIILHAYTENKYWIIIPLIITILQREYIFMALGLIALIDYVKYKKTYYRNILLINIMCFLMYFILRKLFFETGRYAYQTDVGTLLSGLGSFTFPLGPFIKQLIMTLNVFVIYIGLVFYKMYRQLSYDKHEFYKSLFLFMELMCLTFLLGLGNNSGRYFYILTPLFILEIAKEMKAFKLEKDS